MSALTRQVAESQRCLRGRHLSHSQQDRGTCRPAVRPGPWAGAAGEPRPPERRPDHAQARRVLKPSLQVAQLLPAGKSEKHWGFAERPWVSPLTSELSHSPSIVAEMPPGPLHWRSAGHCTARLQNQEGEGRPDRPRKTRPGMAPEILRQRELQLRLRAVGALQS